MELPLTAQSSFLSAFSFPLCYSTPDAQSDSDTSAHCEDQLPILRTIWSTTNCSDSSACANGGRRSRTTIYQYTPLSVPSPPQFTSSAHEQELKNACVGFALSTFPRTAKKDSMETTDGCPPGKTQGISYSAPPALMFAASRGTSVASSFSSESIPVVTTSQGSTEHESSSYTVSGPADGGTQSYDKMLEEEQVAGSAPFCPRVRSANQSPTESALDAVVTAKRDVSEGNLMSNPELALSLESVLTVVPQSLRQSSAAGEAEEPEGKQFIKEQFLKKPSCDVSAWKPRYSTSSCGDVSFQSWDSHLEIDTAIEDIVDSVIHELTICETDFHSCSDTFSRGDSTVDIPRRVSPASLSSYTSSKRLEWDNGADIGYSGASERTQRHERLQYPDIESHIHRSNTSVLINEASVSPEEKIRMFAGPHFRDVVVQTEACSIKDAEVQANASATNLVSTQSGATASTERTDLLVSGSGTEDLNGLAPTRREHSLSSHAEDDHRKNYNEREVPFTAVGHMCAKQKPASRGSFEVPMQDYASSVSLCYSHRILKEASNLKKHASSVRKHAADNNGQVERRHRDFVTAPDAPDIDSSSLDVTGFTIINNNRLKMRFPTAVPGLASRSATPAEPPRACSELYKRRLDYWLSSGFPYVPAVVPLETDALPRIRTADPATAKQDCRDPRLVVSGSSLPSLTQCQKATNMTRAEPAGTATGADGMVRKRYIARPAPLKVSKTSRSDAVLSLQASAPCQKLLRQDKLGIGVPTKPSLVMNDIHSGTPSLSGAAKSTLLSRGHSEDALLSRSNESEVCSSPELLVASRKQQVCGRHSSSTSYSTASEGTSSQLLTVNGKSCKLKRLAHKELEKLRFLVDRQRHGYLKQLQREVERLHRLEQLFLSAAGSRTASSPEAQTTSTEKNSTEDACRITDRNSVAVQTSQFFLENCHSEDDVAKDRCFVSVSGGAGVKKQRDRLSPRKRKPTSKRPVAWVVPFGSNSQYSGSKHRGSSPKGKSQQLSHKEESLQAAFAAHCSRLIKRSEARQSKVASLAERRRMQRSVLPQAQSQERNPTHSHPPGTRGGAPTKKTFTHKEMREQTERVYQKLPEVIDSKKRLHREQQYRTNRLMAQLYKKAIQEKALLGRVNFPLNKPFTQP
ncbi:uncharacterized protein LOC144113702 isoform X2 [Amblyomma americanum]